MKKEVFIFDISVYARMAEMCAEYLKKGRGVRVVGRLAQKDDESVFIVAEHVEFKPELKKAAEQFATVHDGHGE